MRKNGISYLFLALLLSSLSVRAQSPPEFHPGGGLFPLEEELATSSPNPAFPSHRKGVRSSLRIHDRFLLPELALQQFQCNTRLGLGSVFLELFHFGNRLFRRGELQLGYALPVGSESSIGISVGPSQVRIGEGHGTRTNWRAKAGIRSKSGEDWKWELFLSDPHAAFQKTPYRDLLSPSITAGLGRAWKGGHVWSLHLRKELDAPLSWATRTRILLHSRVQAIAGLSGAPLSPLLGWSFAWRAFHFRLISGWTPRLGFTPELTLFHRFGS